MVQSLISAKAAVDPPPQAAPLLFLIGGAPGGTDLEGPGVDDRLARRFNRSQGSGVAMVFAVLSVRNRAERRGGGRSAGLARPHPCPHPHPAAGCGLWRARGPHPANPRPGRAMAETGEEGVGRGRSAAHCRGPGLAGACHGYSH